ncbi:MAG TPA: PhoH family protein, partial [Spirochaetota bacterium]|nr:PhoH family protein [Spirochaetota bacterium]
EIAPLAFMRGRTLNDAFAILDEAQNTTPSQLKMFLTRMGSSAKFIVTGDGPQKEIMKKKMPDAVFTDGLHNGDLSRIYASSDLFVFPSITETFGNVVLEALASGLPVVAAAQGGPKGIIQDGRTGYLAIPKNVEDFCFKILRILDDPVHRDVLARNSVEYAKSQTWDALCELLFKTYENVALMHKPVRTESAVLEMQCI